MSENKERKTCFTNMQEHDPIIEKFMNEYLKEKALVGDKKGIGDNDLIVNFDISYGDGENQAFTCGNESNIFSPDKSGCIETKVDAEEMKCYFGDTDVNITIDDIDMDNLDDLSSIEDDKWLNCEDEWSAGYKKVYKESNQNNDLSRNSDNVKGKVTVFSTLSSRDGNKIKGIKVNLYKLNGVSPELVESKLTDYGGKVVFDNIPEGSYRVIQLIDKRYFEKPLYENWNEVTINSLNSETEIFAINNIKLQYKNQGFKYYK